MKRKPADVYIYIYGVDTLLIDNHMYTCTRINKVIVNGTFGLVFICIGRRLALGLFLFGENMFDD